MTASSQETVGGVPACPRRGLAPAALSRRATSTTGAVTATASCASRTKDFDDRSLTTPVHHCPGHGSSRNSLTPPCYSQDPRAARSSPKEPGGAGIRLGL